MIVFDAHDTYTSGCFVPLTDTIMDTCVKINFLRSWKPAHSSQPSV